MRRRDARIVRLCLKRRRKARKAEGVSRQVDKNINRICQMICALCCWLMVLPMAECAPFEGMLTAETAILINAETGEVLYEKDADKRIYPASTTKMMTAILAIEESSPFKIVNVSEYAARAEGSSARLCAGDRVQMQDMLYGLMLPSGNDAAIAIAEHIDGSVEAFAERMTQKAHEIGAVHTQFANPNGLPDERHYTTARDLAAIASYAYQNKRFRNIVKLEKRSIRVCNTGRTIAYRNTNALLGRMKGCDGIKTGMTRAAGQCLVASASRDGAVMIAVVMKVADGQRWQEAQQLLEYGFGQLTEKKIAA